MWHFVANGYVHIPIFEFLHPSGSTAVRIPLFLYAWLHTGLWTSDYVVLDASGNRVPGIAFPVGNEEFLTMLVTFFGRGGVYTLRHRLFNPDAGYLPIGHFSAQTVDFSMVQLPQGSTQADFSNITWGMVGLCLMAVLQAYICSLDAPTVCLPAVPG